MIALSQARRFLKVLGAHLPGDCEYSFQTFDDKKDRKLSRLLRVLHGKFDAHVDELIEVNEQFGGVFVTVNMTNLKGRESKDIVNLRAVFVDDDQGALSEDPSSYKIAPNIIVKTANGLHVYWLVDRWTDKKLFAPAQIALAAHFGTDPKIKDLCRVMRLPGFNHHKEEETPVRLLHAETGELGKPYKLKEVTDAFGLTLPDLTPKHVKRNQTPSAVTGHSREHKVRRCRAFLLEGIGPAIKGSGDGHADTLGACRAGHDFDLDEGEFLPLLMEWGALCDPPWDPHKLEREFRSVERSGGGMSYPRGNKLGDPKYKRDKPYRRGGDSYVAEDVPWSDDPGGSARGGSFETGGATKLEAPDRGEPWADSPNNTDRSRSVTEGGNDEPPDDDPPDDEPPDDKPRKRRKPKDGERIGQPVEQILSCPEQPSHRDVPVKIEPRHAVLQMLREYQLIYEPAGRFYLYTGSVWRPVTDEMVEKIALQYFPYQKYKPSMAKNAVAIAKQRVSSFGVEWNQLDVWQVPLKSGILDLRTKEMEPHRADHYLDRVIPYDYDPDAKCPRWIQALEEWLPGQDDEKTALQQFLGYILMPRALYKKALLLFGDTDTGKSQVCNIARELAGGSQYVCGILPSEMSDPRARASIKGMALNLIPDLPKWQRIDDGGFKQLVSTGEAVTLDQKYLSAETYLPTAKHVFATNNLPRVSDNTKAVFNRLLIIAFDAVVPKEFQDPELYDKLKEELPGVLTWAVEGAISLFKGNGVWHPVASSEKLVEEYRLEQNEVNDFIEESPKIIKEADGWISAKEFRDMFNDYYGYSGGRMVKSITIGLQVKALGFETQKRKSVRGYLGLRESGPVQLTVMPGGKDLSVPDAPNAAEASMDSPNNAVQDSDERGENPDV